MGCWQKWLAPKGRSLGDQEMATTKRKMVRNGKAQSEKALISQVKKLHSEIMGFYTKSLDTAIEIGSILTPKKKVLGHSNWISWVQNNLPFTDRTASNYMKLYRYKDKLKKEKVSDLQTAYKLLSNPDNHDRHKRRMKSKKTRKEFADRNIKFNNSQEFINSVHCGDNYTLMKTMLANGMAGKYSCVLTSNPYNAGFYYGKDFDDDRPYKEYLKDIVKLFPLYTKLCRPGSRIIYVTGSIVKNKERDRGGDYNHPFVTDLINEVHRVAPQLKLYNNIIWDKSSRKDPLNKQYGSYCDAKCPLSRSVHENILVFANQQFELEDIEGYGSDITPEEFEECAWSIWKVSPYSRPHNPHPCSFPPKLIERLLKFYTRQNDLILDPYAGISTTAQVCKKLNRRFTMLELNPNYCEESVRLLKSA